MIRLSLALLMCGSALAQGIITTIAGNGRYFRGDGGPALSAQLGALSGVTADAAGNVYASDPTNNIVVKVSASGVITRIAGNNIAGYSGDGGPATSASLNNPQGLRVDAGGNVYVADTANSRIRRIAPDGTISTVAGNGTSGFSGDGGPATEAMLAGAQNVTMDNAGNLYISDTNNHRVRKVTPDGIITTIAGNGTIGSSGDGGPAIEAALVRPSGLDVDRAGNVYVGDLGSHVHKISPDGIIVAFAGNGQAGASTGDGGPAVNAAVPFPNFLCVDPDGNVYISSTSIRKVDITGTITTVAGGGSGPDGGPAINANLLGPLGVAFAAGNLYIAESGVGRIRRVNPAGVINAIAGTSLMNYAGDDGPATSSQLSLPHNLAVDSKGNLYVADTSNHRIRRIAPDGRITTVAGNGRSGFAGDGGQATNASLTFPRGVAVDSAGNIYIADSNVNRVRRVNPQGVITTIAGNGQSAFSGDDVPAISAAVGFPTGIALDSSGNLLVAANTQSRIRKITPAGIISTVAGNGTFAFSGDGGPATSASLNAPTSVALDAAGNLYILDGLGRVRRVTPDGVISLFAGGSFCGCIIDGAPATESFLGANGITIDPAGDLYIATNNLAQVVKVSPDGILNVITGTFLTPGFSGDGGQAKSASVSSPSGVALDSAGNLYIADTNNDRIRKILAAPPAISATPTTISFAANTAAADVLPKQITIASPVSLLPWSATTTGGDWLSISPASGTTPANVNVSINTLGLAPGTYRGSITVTALDGDPKTQTVAITLAVAAVNPPRLSVQSSGISFALNTGSVIGTSQFSVVNAGSGTVDFTATTTTDSGGRWLTVAPSSGNLTAVTPATVTVTANPAGLNAGTYTGKIVVSSASTGQSINVPVTITVTGVRQTILLSQTGLTFTAVAGGGTPPPQTLGILNARQGVMSWTVSSSTLPGATGWLSATPGSGSSDAASLSVPLVSVAVRPAGLAAGEYYGQIRVSSAGADNSPQLVSVVLRVLTAGSNPGPVVRPTGLIFASVAGKSPPGSQEVLVSNLTNTPVTFTSGRLTLDGRDWFVSVPPTDTVVPGQPTRLVVQTDTTILTAGIRRGALTLLFSDGNIQTVNLLSVLLASGGSKGNAAAQGCSPTVLLPLLTSLGPNFTVNAGWPTAIDARVVDDCGNVMVTGSVVASFSNGDAPVSLVRLGEGNWSGTWQPRTGSAAGVTVTVTAQIPELNLKGTAQATGSLQSNPNVPVVYQAALVNAASFGPLALVTPGSIISIFGSKLADNEALAGTLPLPVQLGGASVVMGGQQLPLLYVNSGQVNAVVPYGLTVNAQQHVVVQRGTSYSQPEPVTVAEAQPAIFTRDQSGKGQGLIIKGAALADASNPVQAGDVVVVYATGLGEVNPPLAAGVAAPASPPSRTVVPVEARVGGQVATVQFAGLAPGFVGLYQVNVEIPAGIPPAASVPFVLLQKGVPSNTVTVAAR